MTKAIEQKIHMQLALQRLLGWLALSFVGPVSFAVLHLLGYRIKNLRLFRKMICQVFKTHEGPWLICANHLTLIDSVILAFALAPMHRYLIDYRRLPWNVPEETNFQRNILSAVYCFLTKCIPLRRRGDRTRMRQCIDKCTQLLRQKEMLMIFPEGTRSRSGRVDFNNVTYGAGRFLQRIPDCRVLCIYLRGERQESWSSIPALGERFSVRASVLSPNSEESGLRAQRAYALQIIARLAEMERVYFEARGK